MSVHIIEDLGNTLKIAIECRCSAVEHIIIKRDELRKVIMLDSLRTACVHCKGKANECGAK
jgi:hypothetical protein